MSNQHWSIPQTSKKLLPKVELQGNIPVIIPDEVMDKIEYLCKNSPKVEWSGLLFYKVEGSIKNLKKVRIICKDVLLMDIGSAAYTEFNWDEDVVNYRMDNPEAMDWSVGHIHSHNTMAVFFSGTDWSELNDNCPNHNFYLSLIVNNYSETTAKIAFTGDPISFSCLDEEGKKYKLNIQESSEIVPFMFVLNCDVQKREREILVPEVFQGRFAAVQKKVEKQKEAFKAQASALTQKQVNNFPKQGTFFNQKQGRSKNHPLQSQQQQIFSPNLIDRLPFEEVEEEDDTSPIVSDFIHYILNFGEVPIECTTEDTLRKLKNMDVSPDLIASTIIQSYGAYYSSFFEEDVDALQVERDEEFLDVLEEVIEGLKIYEKKYPLLSKTVTGLENLGIKYENYLRDTSVIR